MSHLSTTVQAQIPSVTGSVSLSLDQLSDVSTSASDGDLLTSSASGWVEATAKPNRAGDYVGIPTAEGYFPTSSAVYTSIYDVSGFYSNIRTTTSIPLSVVTDTAYCTSQLQVYAQNSKYWYAFSLVAGYKYQLEANLIIPENSSSGAWVRLQWRTSTGTTLGAKGYIYRQSERKNPIFGYVDTTGASGATIVGLTNLGQSGTCGFMQAGTDTPHLQISARIVE